MTASGDDHHHKYRFCVPSLGSETADATSCVSQTRCATQTAHCGSKSALPDLRSPRTTFGSAARRTEQPLRTHPSHRDRTNPNTKPMALRQRVLTYYPTDCCSLESAPWPRHLFLGLEPRSQFALAAAAPHGACASTQRHLCACQPRACDRCACARARSLYETP